MANLPNLALSFHIFHIYLLSVCINPDSSSLKEYRSPTMDSLLFIFFFFFLTLLALLLLMTMKRRRKLPLPPGPRGYPIVENMLMMDQLTHRGLMSLAEKYDSLLHLRLGFLHAVTVSTPEMARQVVQLHENLFPNRPATIAIKYLIPWLRWLDMQGINKRLRQARVSLDSFIDRIIDDHMKNRKDPDNGDTDMVDDMLAFLDESPTRNAKEPAYDLQASLKLTPNHIKGKSSTLVASVNFVDLGGSERAWQALSAGTRLKEGCHINRSLLKFPGSASSTSHFEALLRGKDAQINKMEKEIKELIRQRDLAQSQLKNFLRVAVDDHASRRWEESSQVSTSHVTTSAYDDVVSMSDTSGFPYRGLNFSFTKLDKSMGTEDWNELHLQRSGKLSEHDTFSSRHSISSSNFVRLIPQRSEKNTHESVVDFEDHCKDVQCIENNESSTTERKEHNISFNERTESQLSTATNQEYSDARPQSVDSPAITLEQQLQNVRKRIDDLVRPYHDELSSVSSAVKLSSSQSLGLTKSRSCRTSMNSVSSPWFQEAGQTDCTPPSSFLRNFTGRLGEVQRKHIALNCDIESETLLGLKEMAQIQYDKQCGNSQIENEDVAVDGTRKDVGVDPMLDPPESPSQWQAEFEKKQQKIVELWDQCNVSLVHRSCFFLLFKGDPADSIYMEVELRRLSFLGSASHKNLDRAPVQDSLHITQASSLRKLQREREMLCKQMHKRLSAEERRSLYTKWGIALDSKQRKLQLARSLWTETKDMEHIRESATLVAKLIGLLKPEQALREMFGLSFTPQLTGRRLFGWKHGLTSLK